MCIVSHSTHNLLYISEFEGKKQEIYFAGDEESNVETKMIVPTQWLFLYFLFLSVQVTKEGGDYGVK